MQPQREGGGNNVYGADIAARLRAGGSDLAQYILMERIRPPVSEKQPGMGMTGWHAMAVCR